MSLSLALYGNAEVRRVTKAVVRETGFVVVLEFWTVTREEAWACMDRAMSQKGYKKEEYAIAM